MTGIPAQHLASQQIASHVELLANIVSKDLVVRYFADGEAIVFIDVVVSRKQAGGDGQVYKDFLTLCVRGAQAEVLQQQAQAGQGIHVWGQLRHNHDKASGKHSVVLVESLRLLGASTPLSWNRVTGLAEIAHISALGKGRNNQAGIKLQLKTREQDATTWLCQFFGYPAEMLAQQASVGQQLLFDAQLRQTKSAGKELPYSLFGHTCQLIKQPDLPA